MFACNSVLVTGCDFDEGASALGYDTIDGGYMHGSKILYRVISCFMRLYRYRVTHSELVRAKKLKGSETRKDKVK